MSLQGIVLIDLLGLGLIVLILNLVRTQRLHVAHGALWLLAVTALIILISVPPLLAFITTAVGAVYPASAVSLLAFVFIFVVLIFFSVQLSTLTDRQVKLAQALALKRLVDEAEAAAPDRSSDPPAPTRQPQTVQAPTEAQPE